MTNLIRMSLTTTLIYSAIALATGSSVAAQESQRPLSMFRKSATERPCYDRSKLPQTTAVDAHMHAYPFGGRAVRYNDLLGYLTQPSIETRFVVLMGIGQTLPYDGACTYYKNCPGTPVVPSIRNDFNNAANWYANPQENIDVTLSMSFPDLTKPADVAEKIRLLDAEYPGLYKWMGEVNLYKYALLPNGFVPPTFEEIANWKAFMEVLRERGIPMGIHLDLGEDGNAARNLPLLQEVLRLYPDNKIVWMHLGISGKDIRPSVEGHIKILSDMLDKYPNLSIDLSASYYDGKSYFDTPEKRAAYVALLNRYPTRFLSGSDFVAGEKKTAADYKKESLLSFDLIPEINDEAFRHIALGQNYFNVTPGLAQKYEAPKICKR